MTFDDSPCLIFGWDSAALKKTLRQIDQAAAVEKSEPERAGIESEAKQS
jgi:DNA polymerase III sliding clamp (beta) subunit (PCNA family)